jgi:hypothetical protein
MTDTGMLVKNMDASHGGTPQTYAADLVAEIKASVPSICARRSTHSSAGTDREIPVQLRIVDQLLLHHSARN